jgi:hypothetical protein
MTKELPEGCTKINDKIAYSWFVCAAKYEEPEGTCIYGTDCAHDIKHLHVWHWCDGHLEVEKRGPVEDGWFPCWRATGVQLHDFISAEPLHLAPSLLWPDCCGEHGFITNGQWVQA